MTNSTNLQGMLDKIYQSAVEAMAGLIDTRNLYIAIYDEANQRVEFALVREGGEAVSLQNQSDDSAKIKWRVRSLGERKGLTEWVIRNKQSLLIEHDFDTWARQRDDVDVYEGVTKCWLGAPMIYRDKVIGVIGLQNFERENVFDEQHQALLETIASQAAVAIENARQQQQLQEQQERRIELERERAHQQEALAEERGQRLQLEQERAREQKKLAEERGRRLVRLQEITERMTEASLSPDSVLELVARAARELSHSDWASLYLFDAVTERFSRGVQVLPDETVTDVAEIALPSPNGFPARMARRQETRFVADVSQHEDAVDFASRRKIRAFAGLPLAVGRVAGQRAVVGLLFVNFDRAHTFSKEQQEILQHLANQAAIAIDYASVRQSAQAGEQLAALGTAAATLQHRLGNTINVILPAVMRLRFRIGSDPENEEILQAIERNALFATEVIRRMQTPLREEAFVETNFNALLEDAIKKCVHEKDRFAQALITTNLPDFEPVRPVAGEPTVRIEIVAELAQDLPLSSIKTGQLTEVFRVLVENAMKAIYVEETETPKVGRITVQSRLIGDRSRPCVEIVVSDNGKGMDEATRGRLFKQPVPRKEFGQGAGLGLWLSHIIVRSHEGGIEVASTEVGGGSTFKVTLPILPKPPVPQKSVAPDLTQAD